MKLTGIIAALACAALVASSCGNSEKTPALEGFTYNAGEFQNQYTLNKADWDAALEFIARQDLDTLTAGPWHQLTPTTRARVQKTFTKEVGKWEVHRNVIDVFYVLDGIDKVGISSSENLGEIVREYSEKSDSEIYASSSNPSYAVLERHKGIILFPGEGHSPNLCTTAPDSLKLVVVKIPYIRQ